jgi:rhomboid protease GluP
MFQKQRPEESAGSADTDNSIWRGGDFEKRPRHPTPILMPFVCTVMCVFYLSNVFPGQDSSGQDLEPWGYYTAEAIRSGAFWSYITSTFVHLRPVHFGFNLYWMWILGGALERSIGTLRWLGFFVAAAWISSGLQFLSGDTGIGMSGVGYALFGFGWRAREQMPQFQRVLTDYVYRGFIVWLFFCIVATYAGTMNVGNGAHVGGMLFGMAAAEAFVNRRRVSLMLVGIGALILFSTLPLLFPIEIHYDQPLVAPTSNEKPLIP